MDHILSTWRILIPGYAAFTVQAQTVLMARAAAAAKLGIQQPLPTGTLVVRDPKEWPAMETK